MGEGPKERKTVCLIIGGLVGVIIVPLIVTFMYQLPLFSTEWWILTTGGELVVGSAVIGITFGTQENKFWT